LNDHSTVSGGLEEDVVTPARRSRSGFVRAAGIISQECFWARRSPCSS